MTSQQAMSPLCSSLSVPIKASKCDHDCKTPCALALNQAQGDKCAHVRRKPGLRKAEVSIESWQHLPEDEMLPSTSGTVVRPLFLATNSPDFSQAALRLIPAFLLILILLSPMAHAQGNYVYVNNQDVANSISGFAVSSTGALSAVPGSPYLTGGIGSTTTCIGLDRITISAPQNLLFVSNSGDQTISIFQINPAT